MRAADEKLIINEFGPQYECDTLIDLPREREGKKGSLKTECKIAHKSPSAKLCRGWFMSDQLVLCFHLQVQTAKPMVDTSAPRVHPHVTSKWKKQQV